jgi:hypothetical protein
MAIRFRFADVFLNKRDFSIDKSMISLDFKHVSNGGWSEAIKINTTASEMPHYEHNQEVFQ